MSLTPIRCVCALLIMLGCGAAFGAITVASESYLLWTGDAPVVSNHPPEITSIPPVMSSSTYAYDVEAFDQDGDPITFTLTDAPDGMTIDAATGVITWTALEAQIGSYTPSVIAADNNGGLSAPQPIPLTVTGEMFPLTVPWLEGVNLTDRSTEQDDTVLSLGAGADMSGITDIILPKMAQVFSFSDGATFHVELQAGQPVIVPEPTVAQIAIEDTDTGGTAFAAIQADTLTELTWQPPTPQIFSATQTIVFQRVDGTSLKIGMMTMNLTNGTITLAYADVTPAAQGGAQ